MHYIPLGDTALRVSRLCLGCMTFGEPDRGRHAWTLPEESSRPLIQHAIEGGINFFDTANSYSDGSSEEIVGRALRDFARRDEVVVATKVYHQVGDLAEGLSRAQILRSIDDSLRRLGMDYVDLLQIHRWDYTTPIEETLEALDEVVKAGSHITGGGFYENIPRMLPEGKHAVVEKNSYPVPPIFTLMAREGNVDEHMMYNTYNMGLGMVLAVDPADVDKTMEAIKAAGDTPYVVGKITDGEKGVTLC